VDNLKEMSVNFVVTMVSFPATL